MGTVEEWGEGRRDDGQERGGRREEVARARTHDEALVRQIGRVKARFKKGERERERRLVRMAVSRPRRRSFVSCNACLGSAFHLRHKSVRSPCLELSKSDPRCDSPSTSVYSWTSIVQLAAKVLILYIADLLIDIFCEKLLYCR